MSNQEKMTTLKNARAVLNNCDFSGSLEQEGRGVNKSWKVRKQELDQRIATGMTTQADVKELEGLMAEIIDGAEQEARQ